MPFRSFLILSIFLSLTSLQKLHAQSNYSVSGSVVDSDNEVIAAAQVFLSGTTIGTTTDENGVFQLNGVPEGIFELIVSFLGFETASYTINTNSLESQYNFILNPKIYELDEVTVRPDPEEWKANFRQFRKIFIGVGPFSEDTKIKNPEVLNFFFEPEQSMLTANANERLVIENKALGYIIYYYLDYFVIDYRQNTSFYFGRPLYELMTSSRERTNNRWESNREKAYQGSFLHFTKSLINNTEIEDSFVIRGEKRENRSRFVSKDTVDANKFFMPYDSTTYMFSFMNFVNVTFEAEKEDRTYLYYTKSPFARKRKSRAQFQNSSFTITQDTVLVDKSGYIYDPIAIIFDGYWGFEKVSDMLPLDYLPKK